jgi:hypothetical protein
MRWEYQTPEQKLFLSDGNDVLLYVPSQKQLTRTPMKESEDVRVPVHGELLICQQFATAAVNDAILAERCFALSGESM